MKRWIVALAAWLIMANAPWAAPMRIALMDFTDASGGSADQWLGGQVDSEQLASKGTFAVSRALLGRGDFVLIDRRDFINQMESMRIKLDEQVDGIRPSFIQAAQALRADVVLRGMLQSFSVSKQTVTQGGQHVEFATVSVRVGLDALDAIDGTVIAAVEGVARERFRQTDMMRTELGSDEIHQMLTAAVQQATPELVSMLNEGMTRREQRETVMLSVDTTDNPAMVEIDGILVGSTPLENLSVYKGDHVLTIRRPGYEPITRRLVLDNDTRISAPMLRVDLTPEERIDILKSADLRVFIREGERPDLLIEVIE